MTKIFVDYGRSLRQLWTNRHRYVSSTSTSRNQWEYTGSNAKEYSCQNRRWWTLFYLLIFSFHFILFFFFLFNFLFLEQLGLGFISHAVTSVTNWWRRHKTDHRTWKNEVEGSRTKWHHTAWTTHASLMLYSWLFRVGCTVASTDHE